MIKSIPDRLRAANARSEARRVWLFTGLLAAVAAGGYWTIIRRPASRSRRRSIRRGRCSPRASSLAETKVVDVHFRRETHSFSLSEIPAVIGLFFLTPDEYLGAVLVGSAAALAARLAPVSPLKIAFNLSNFAVIAVVDLAVFHALAVPSGPPGPTDWLAAFAATLSATRRRRLRRSRP